MAVTIVRTPWIDDDGTGTTGTVINNAVKTALYNDIDGALAKVAQLAGGNSFTGNQTIAGLLSVSGFGTHGISANGTGQQSFMVRNAAAGTSNQTQIAVGNDTDASLLALYAFSSTYAPASDLAPNGGALRCTGAGGMALTTTVAAPIKFWTNFAERMRIAPTGEVLIGQTAVIPYNGALAVTTDGSVHSGISILNTYVNNAINAIAFLNSVGGLAGAIQQTGATSVVYGTSSDARLKADAGRATDLAALRGVVVHDFAWKADGRTDRGVFAQETHAVFPRAVSPGTDETTESGALARPWMTDYSKFVPDLIVGWQQHDAELAELRALLATVKG